MNIDRIDLVRLNPYGDKLRLIKGTILINHLWSDRQAVLCRLLPDVIAIVIFKQYFAGGNQHYQDIGFFKRGKKGVRWAWASPDEPRIRRRLEELKLLRELI